MYRSLSNFYPKKIKADYLNLLKYSGINIKSDRFVGFILVFGFLIALTFAFYGGIMFKIDIIILFFASFFLFQIIIYFWLLLRADAKAKFVESILPDVLQLMSSNLRSGLTTDRALILSARPEFGPFQDEINLIGKEITMGKEIDVALTSMAQRIKSERLRKTVDLIATGLNAGGELALLLDQTARNLRREMIVDSRIRANVMMYVIFIAVAVGFGAPLLFGLSSFLVDVLTKIMGSISIPEAAAKNLPISFQSVGISPKFVLLFSIVFLTTSSILGSLILGLVSKGKEQYGLKFMPFLVLTSLVVFFLIRTAISSVMGTLFTF